MAEEQITIDIQLSEHDDAHLLLGAHDKHIKIIEEAIQVIIRTRGQMIQIQGAPSNAEKASLIIRSLQELIHRGIPVSSPDVVTAIKMAEKGTMTDFVAN